LMMMMMTMMTCELEHSFLTPKLTYKIIHYLSPMLILFSYLINAF
jgi:hypothetical protein